MLKQISYLLFATTILVSCGGDNKKTEEVKNVNVTEEVVENDNKLDEELQAKLDIIISNNLLVPVSIISNLKRDGKSLYHADYLNSLDNVSKYNDEFSKALNFGIYGVDIIYDIAHNHIDEVVDYRDKTVEMAKSLGLDSFYIEEDMRKFQSIAKDDNAVSQFVFDEYHKIDDYLISHDRFETMTLMLAGGIIESMYFTGRAIEEYGISDLKYTLLLNERNSIAQLIDLLNNFKNHEKDQILRAELEKLQTAFNSFSSKEDLTADKIKELDGLVITLRNKITANEL